MKNLFLLSFLVSLGITTHSQNTIQLKLSHLFKGDALAFNQNYQDSQDRAVELTRVRYYLSSIKVTHDGGQVTPLTDVYVLGEGNVSNYIIDGSYDINSVEKIQFDLGVDSLANHGNTSNYDAQHPLGPKTPLMDWGWPSGYFFLVLHGSVDSDNNGSPNQGFQIESFGDILLRTANSIDYSEAITAQNNKIEIPIYVNVDRWFADMDFATIGFNHGAYQPNKDAADNTVAENVFTAGPPNQVNIQEQFNKISFVTTDYSMPYAPVLFFKLPKSNYSLSIIDVNGRRVVQQDNIGFEGNYFVKSELQTGIYFAIFTSFNGYQKTHQFIVNR